MIIITLLFLFAYVLSVAVVGYVIFAPLMEVAQRKPIHPVRFQLTDLLAFFIPFQFGFAVINWSFPDIDWNVGVATAVAIVLLLITGLAWLYGLRLLWRMDVQHWVKRIVLLGVVMPMGFVAPIVAFSVVAAGSNVQGILVRLALIAAVTIAVRGAAIWVRPSKFQSAMEQIEFRA